MDLIDKKLLFELDKNARIPYTKLAKKLKTSPQKIKYRVNNLVKKGIIKNFLTITEYKKISYTNHVIYLRLQNLTEEKEKRIFNYFKQHKNINVIIRFNARFDVALSILTKSIFELNEIISDINNKFSDLIREKDVATHIGAYRFFRNYILNKKELTFLITGKEEEKIKLDNLDLKLISLLNDNARYSLIELAQKLKVSADTVKYRIKKLEKEKIILGYTILINPEKINYSYYRILLKLKNINKEKEKQLINFCNLNSNIIYYVKTFGNWEVTIDTEIEHQKFRELLNELNNKFNDIIQDYETLEVFEILKFRYFTSTQQV